MKILCRNLSFKLSAFFAIIFVISAPMLVEAQANSRYSINERFRAVSMIGDFLIQKQNNKDGYLYPDYCDAHIKDCPERIRLYVKYIFDAAEEYRLDPWLLIAIAMHSTDFNATKKIKNRLVGILRLPKEYKNSGYMKFFRQPEVCSIVQADACQKMVIFYSVAALSEIMFFCEKDLSSSLNRYYNGVEGCSKNKNLYNEVTDVRNKIYLKSRSIPNICSEAFCLTSTSKKTEFWR